VNVRGHRTRNFEVVTAGVASIGGGPMGKDATSA
jgi:hypothetical protein